MSLLYIHFENLKNLKNDRKELINKIKINKIKKLGLWSITRMNNTMKHTTID
jgi:hypothetical protein